MGGMGFVGWGLWDGREQKVGFAEKKLRLCLAGLPCMAMPVQVRALRGGRKILRPYKWENRGYSGYRGCGGAGVLWVGWVWIWGWGMDLLKLNNMLIFVE